MKKLNKKMQHIVIAEEKSTLVAWDYDERLYKKVHFLSKPIFNKNGIEVKELESPWPHISAVYVLNPMTHEEREKFSLAADLVKPEFGFKQLAIFPGNKFDFFAVEFSVPPQFEKFIKFAEEVCGKDRIKRFYDKQGKPDDRPHVSIWAIDKKDTEKAVGVLEEIKKEVKKYLRPFTPAKVSFWDEFQISKIEQLSAGASGKSFKSKVAAKYIIIWS